MKCTRQVSPLQGQPGGGSGSLWVPAASFQPCSAPLAPPEPCASPHPCCCCIGTKFLHAAEPLRLPPWLCCKNWLWFTPEAALAQVLTSYPGASFTSALPAGGAVSEGYDRHRYQLWNRGRQTLFSKYL